MSLPSGWKEFQDGNVLSADEINGYLQQGVLVFDDASTRDSSLVGYVREGMLAYVKDNDEISFYDGSSWNLVTGNVEFASEAARDAAIPAPSDGRYAFTTDRNLLWKYITSAWVNLNAPAVADFSDTATGTYSSGGINYKYKTYTTSGTLTITRGGLCDVVIVAGGGGGATESSNNGVGGGGAGGMLVLNNVYLNAATHTIVVGAGGACNSITGGVDQIAGSNGQASRLGPYYAVGGGPGWGSEFSESNNTYGGSGGGGMGGTGAGAGGAGTSGQGNNGGLGFGGDFIQGGGGGGGAGATGGNASSNTGGNGGAGLATSITGTSVTLAGGGGGNASSGTAGSGGAGGGGAGGTNTGGTAGTANTGGGGGANGSGGTSGTGGSGIVIVRVRTN